MQRSKSIRRRLIAALAAFLLFAATLEYGVARIIDPWGAWRYFNDLASLYSHYRTDPRGFVVAPGDYHFEGWTATILLDATRYVPETSTWASCTVALVGDSVTFGLGVSDDATWANLVARELPRVRIINTGVPAYNAQNAATTMKQVQADGYFYLLIGNDDEPPPNWQNARPPAWAIQVYLYTWQFAARDPYVPMPGIEGVISEIASSPKVMIVAFDSPGLGRDLAAKYPISLIRPYTERISRADSHANEQGNWQVAEAVMPHLRALISKVCIR